MRVVFRCDASIQIGTGHVMRCLTLADALVKNGAECHFICREHEGHLLELIRQRGHHSYSLALNENMKIDSSEDMKLSHAAWLGVTQQQDVQCCIGLLELLQPDWLIVDHYALDAYWEESLRPYCKNLMVIDDLADRRHDCDILLDQTFGRHTEDYLDWVHENCQVLSGSKYALLRPEFAKWRDYSLERRKDGMLKHLLINLGGVDKDNITSKILKGLQNSSLPECCKITVVMGSTAPWVESVKAQAKALPWKTQVKSGINNMAELMADSDLAIGAAGSTIWERFCLGLPTILLVIAENQETNLSKVKPYHISSFRNNDPNVRNSLVETINQIISNYTILESNTALIQGLVDGQGVIRISQTLSKE